MRIAQIVSLAESVPPKSQNGLEFVVSWITEELVRRGHEVTLFAPGDSETQAKLISVVPQGTNHDSTQIAQSSFESWNNVLAAIKSEDFDIVHSHSRESSTFTPFFSAPVVQTLHHPYSLDFGNLLTTDSRLHSYTQTILDHFSKINYVTVSNNQSQGFMNASETFFKKHTTIHNGIHIEKFTFNPRPKDYLLYVGYINKNKGADVAVQVALTLDMPLILAGNMYGEEAFFDTHIKPFLSEKIQYVGRVNFEQKDELYRNALVKIAPLAWDEPFGLTLVESQACGTPVVAFNKGASSEIIVNGKTGFIVNTFEEMCDAIGKINSLDRHMCRAHVEKNFSVERMVDEYEKLYRSLIL